MKRRTGIFFKPDGTHEIISCIVTGEMSDGTKVWTECTADKEPINIDRQYILKTGGGFSEFVKM